MFEKIVIGLDESYQDTGIAAIGDKKLLTVKSIDFKGLKTKTQKRKHLQQRVKKLLDVCTKRGKQVIIILERIRTFSYGGKGAKFNLSTDYIKATAALIAYIVDLAAEYEIPVYSVDTRSWKAQVLGSSKSKGNLKNKSNNKNKVSTIRYVKEQYGVDVSYKVSKGKNKGQTRYNDNKADAICIAEYGFIPPSLQKLKLES